ncbi:MAG: pyrrolysine--tRNA(Pyl) ligase large subunit [Candidatus Methanomethylophilaceae archaeon]
MDVHFTVPQVQRLKELGCDVADDGFKSVSERESAFASIMTDLNRDNLSDIESFRAQPRRNELSDIEFLLAGKLIELGFMEFKTPTIISKDALDKMSITEGHPLRRQVFFIDDKRCMRPMLAPNLYVSMKNLRKCMDGPIGFFEIGPCYRKESHSSRHLEEFTMLNLVIMDPDEEPMSCLRSCISKIMEFLGMEYELRVCHSDVYVETIDVEVEGLEVASGAVGPHILDKAHGIDEPWCGVGFGIERLLMIKRGDNSIRRSGRSLAYLNGARIDI